MTLNVGEPAPDFALESTEGTLRLADFRGKKLLLTFYQEDETPTCTSQVTAFSEDYPMLAELGAGVIAVSADDLEAHRRFAGRLADLPFPLASDPTLEVARRYDVVDDTGKRTRRAAFVIDEEGKIALAIPWYNPSNVQQYEDIFRALGMDV